MKKCQKNFFEDYTNTSNSEVAPILFITNFLAPTTDISASDNYKGRIINKAQLAKLKVTVKVFKILDKKIIGLQKECVKNYRLAVIEGEKKLSCKYILQIKALAEIKRKLKNRLKFLKETKRDYLKYIYSSIKNFINHYNGFNRLDLEAEKTNLLYYGGEDNIV